jgi:hypothetical protein
MQVHEITQGRRLTEAGMVTHFVAGLTGQNPNDIPGLPGSRAEPTGFQPGETPDQTLKRVQNDPNIRQLISNMEKEWATYIKANPALLNPSTPVPEAVDSGYAPLPGSGIMVPNTMTKTVAPPPPAASTANTTQQAQDSYTKAFGNWARSKLSGGFDPKKGFGPADDPDLTKFLGQLADAAIKKNAAGVSTAFKNYMNLAIAAVQIHTAQNAKKTSPTQPSNNPAAAGTPDVTSVLQKANLTKRQLQALGQAVGIPTGQRVKNTGNEQLNNIIRAMGIQVLA